jgi:hypothetical protein
MSLLIGTVIAIVVVFTVVGLGVTFNALRVGRAETRAHGDKTQAAELREKIRRYVGPVDPKTALLNPPARVLVEFAGAVCGFPGLGWLCSGSVFAGLLLICCGPAFAWGFYPVFLSLTGKLASRPYIVIEYLPGIAVASAAILAYREVLLARKRKQEGRRDEQPAGNR